MLTLDYCRAGGQLVDKKAHKILFDTYWASSGWKPEGDQVASSDDFRHAKQAGVMFDPVRRSHREIVRRALDVRARVNPQAVAYAYLASLSTRRLELRSALGSYAVLRHFPDHDHHDNRLQCRTCGEYDREGDEIDLSVLNFERFKWGGVRHTEPTYASFDLELFLKSEHPAPREADRAIFREVLRAVEAAPPPTTGPQLQSKLAKLFPSNKAEREVVINILGYCGILRSPGYPGFGDRFIPFSDRDEPDYHFVDMSYPACWWRGRDGVDHDAVSAYFPGLGDSNAGRLDDDHDGVGRPA